MSHQKKIQHYRPINGILAPIFCFTLLLRWGNRPKIWFGHNFWLEGPIDLRPTRLNCILQDLFRDTPLDHIWRTEIRTQIWSVFNLFCLCPSTVVSQIMIINFAFWIYFTNSESGVEWSGWMDGVDITLRLLWLLESLRCQQTLRSVLECQSKERF